MTGIALCSSYNLSICFTFMLTFEEKKGKKFRRRTIKKRVNANNFPNGFIIQQSLSQKCFFFGFVRFATSQLKSQRAP